MNREVLHWIAVALAFTGCILWSFYQSGFGVLIGMFGMGMLLGEER